VSIHARGESFDGIDGGRAFQASRSCRDHENTKVHEGHEKDLSFFFVIFADLRAFVVAFLSGGLVEGAKIVGEELS